MKFKVTKTEYEGLPPEFQKEYIVSGGDYELHIEGGEDTGALKRTVDHLREDLRKAGLTQTELKTKNSELENAIKNSPSVQDIEAAKAEGEAKVKTANGWIERSLISGKSLEIASKISKAPTLLQPLLEARLVVVFDKKTGEPKLSAKKADGSTDDKFGFDQLQKEFVDNKEFAPIILGNLATGGSAPAGQQASGTGPASQSQNTEGKPASQLPKAVLMERIKAKQAVADGNSGGAA